MGDILAQTHFTTQSHDKNFKKKKSFWWETILNISEDTLLSHWKLFKLTKKKFQTSLEKSLNLPWFGVTALIDDWSEIKIERRKEWGKNPFLLFCPPPPASPLLRITLVTSTSASSWWWCGDGINQFMDPDTAFLIRIQGSRASTLTSTELSIFVKLGLYVLHKFVPTKNQLRENNFEIKDKDNYQYFKNHSSKSP